MERPASGTNDRHDLANIALMQRLDGDERAQLESRCNWRRYRLGERVFERGSAGDEVYFVVEGSVNIVSFSPTGREVAFATSHAGDTVGELAAIDGQPRSASVVAAEDTLLAVLPSDAFVALVKQHGDIAFRLLQRLSMIVRKGDDRVLEVSSLKETNRVYAELLRLAEPADAAPDLWAIKPLPSLRDLASSASTTRELVSNALNALYPGGLIRRQGNNLYIMDRAALDDIVNAATESGADQ